MRTKENTNKEHRSIVELLPLYVNNSLDAERRVRVDRHLENCSDCRQELAFEQKLQQAIAVNVDVSQLAIHNLAKFIEMFNDVQMTVDDDRLAGAKNSESDLKSEAGKPGFDPLKRLAQLLKSVTSFPGRQFPSGRFPSGQFNGALALGFCALVAIGILYQPTRDAYYSGKQNSEDFVRSCESSDEIRQYEFSVGAADSTPVNIEAVEMLLKGAFPATHYAIVQRQDALLITVDGTVCDKRIPKVTRSLEEQQSIGSVTVRNLSGG